MHTSENTWLQLQQSSVDIAVVPIGATEQHGTNLPLCTDSLEGECLARALAEDLDAYLTPLLPVGSSSVHLSFPGTLSIKEQTLKLVVADIADSLVKTGFNKIIFLSIHGGNRMLWRSNFLSELAKEYQGVKIVSPSMEDYWKQAQDEAGITSGGAHADETEAAIVMAVRPELVGSEPTDVPDYHQRMKAVECNPFGFPLDVKAASPSGALGEPSKATREKGEKFIKIIAELLIDDIRTQLGMK